MPDLQDVRVSRNSMLTVPTSHRFSDYFGIWCYEPERFALLWRTVRATDLPRHMAAGPPARQPTMNLQPGRDGKSVAVIEAVGTLMKGASSFGGTSTVQLRRDVRQAAADPTVSGILMRFDSPGGTVAGTADLAGDVRAARRKKPVWAQVEDLGASAAYWIASQADVIYANNPTALVGSIGTFMTVYDASKAASAEGVEVLVFATGPLKGAGAAGAPVTDEQRAHFQGIVNEAQAHFDAAVKGGRGMTQAQLTAARTGGVYSGQTALDMKLIDGIQSADKTLAQLIEAK